MTFNWITINYPSLTLTWIPSFQSDYRFSGCINRHSYGYKNVK